MPASEPNRNFLPSFRAPRINRGTFRSMVITPISGRSPATHAEPSPNRSCRRRSDRSAPRNRSKPSAKIAQPRVIFQPICQMVLSVSRFKPSSSRTSFAIECSSFICVSPVSSFPQERSSGGQRPGRIAAHVGDRRFLQFHSRFDDRLALEAHHGDALRRARGLGGKLRRGEHEHTPVRCADSDLLFLPADRSRP